MAEFATLPPELLPRLLPRPAACLRLVCRRWLRALRLAYPGADHRTSKVEVLASVEVARWYHDLDPSCGSWLCYGAAAFGRLAVLQWARSLDPPCPWGEGACTRAALNGHLTVLQWARAQAPPCPWDEWMCHYAAARGHLAVLQWVRAQAPPCPWDERTSSGAAKGGHLAVLRWARAQTPPCPWNERTSSAAAEGGHLAVLRWARAQTPPCPWNEWLYYGAAEGDHLAVLQWARAQEPPCPWAEEVGLEIAQIDRPEILQWACAQGLPLDYPSSCPRARARWPSTTCMSVPTRACRWASRAEFLWPAPENGLSPSGPARVGAARSTLARASARTKKGVLLVSAIVALLGKFVFECLGRDIWTRRAGCWRNSRCAPLRPNSALLISLVALFGRLAFGPPGEGVYGPHEQNGPVAGET
jgi:hypothetical protein